MTKYTSEYSVDVSSRFVGLNGDETKALLNEMYEWCRDNCRRELYTKSAWGTAWWTISKTFIFTHEYDAMIFRLKYG